METSALLTKSGLATCVWINGGVADDEDTARGLIKQYREKGYSYEGIRLRVREATLESFVLQRDPSATLSKPLDSPSPL